VKTLTHISTKRSRSRRSDQPELELWHLHKTFIFFTLSHYELRLYKTTILRFMLFTAYNPQISVKCTTLSRITVLTLSL